MDSDHLRTPQAQQNLGTPAHLMSSSSSIRSEDSFISQVPLPYHLPASQDARYANYPTRPASSMSTSNVTGGHGQQRKALNFAPIPEHPSQMTATGYGYGGHPEMPTMQDPRGGYVQYEQHRPASNHNGSSYNPYGGSDNGYEQSLGDGRNFQYAPGQPVYNAGPSQGYNQGHHALSKNQYQSQYEIQNQQVLGGYQSGFGQSQQTFGSYQSGFGQSDRGPGYIANRFSGAGASNYGDGSRGYGRKFKDESLLSNRGLQRRRSAGPAQHYANSRFNQHAGGPSTRHASFGEESFERPPANFTVYETHAVASPASSYLDRSGASTPTGRYAQPLAAPTPRTARELGEATPTLLEHTVRKSKHDASRGPPPPFALSTMAQSPAKGPRGRSNTQDPFTSAPVRVTHPQHRRALSTTEHSIVGPIKLLVGPSPHLAALCPGGVKPSVTVAFDIANMPFVETARLHPNKSTTGVIHVLNIPFHCSSQEVLAFFGRNARTIPEHEEPVHIVMERVTSKTMDAFVEFVDVREAIYAVERFDANKQAGRGGRLGDRSISLEVCGHDVLMQALFPRATNVKWVGIDPKIIDAKESWNTGFKGFVSPEELVMLAKHVECPGRSPFSKDCPQRPYECLISTLIKFPWNRLDLITLRDRDALFETTLALCKHLAETVKSANAALQLDVRLVRRIKRAVFNCHGFSESQKDDFAFIFGMESIDAGLPPYAEYWFVLKTIGAKRGWAPDVLLYYIALIREATSSSAVISLAEQAARGQQTSLASPFGDLKIEYPSNVSSMSLADVGAIEWHAIEGFLRKILPND